MRKMTNYVAPYVGAWIETQSYMTEVDSSESHPTWVRGLKRFSCVGNSNGTRSHPTWVRGLKQKKTKSGKPVTVAPYVGAWIETRVSL